MKGTIYLMSNSVDDKLYVGSTTQSLKKRFTNHRAVAKSGDSRSRLHDHMCKIGLYKWVIEAIKICEVSDRKQLEKLEFKCIQNYPKGQLLNMNTVYKKISQESRKKLSVSQRSDRSSKFKRGCIRHITQLSREIVFEYIIFKWHQWDNDVRVQKTKSFSVKRYGLRGAMKMAKEYQNKIYPKPE